MNRNKKTRFLPKLNNKAVTKKNELPLIEIATNSKRNEDQISVSNTQEDDATYKVDCCVQTFDYSCRERNNNALKQVKSVPDLFPQKPYQLRQIVPSIKLSIIGTTFGNKINSRSKYTIANNTTINSPQCQFNQTQYFQYQNAIKRGGKARLIRVPLDCDCAKKNVTDNGKAGPNLRKIVMTKLNNKLVSISSIHPI